MYKALLVILAGILFLGQTPRIHPQVEIDKNYLVVNGFDKITLSLYGEEGYILDTTILPPAYIPSSSLPMGRYLLVVNDDYNNQKIFKFNHELKN